MMPPEAVGRKAYLRLYAQPDGDSATYVLSINVIASPELLEAAAFADRKGQGGINVRVTKLELVPA
jgi:hypothetical protein